MLKKYSPVLSLLFLVPACAYAQLPQVVPNETQQLILQLQEKIKELQLQILLMQEDASTDSTLQNQSSGGLITQTLSRGMSGDEVRELQQMLAKDPLIYPSGIISGYFGALTEEAVKRYQEAHGIDPVGVVGPKTRVILNTKESPRSTIMDARGAQTAPSITLQSVTPETPSSQGNTNNSTPPATVTPPTPAPVQATGTYTPAGGYSSGVRTYVSEPVSPTPPSPPSPPSATSTESGGGSSSVPPAPPVSPPPAPAPAPTPTPDPTPSSPTITETLGPTITSLSITPISTITLGPVSFVATAEDPSGIKTIVYNIRYPAAPGMDGAYYLRPNCNYNGVTSGTCGFGESIDHGRQNPSVLGDYTIDSIDIYDMHDSVATYYPDGTVVNGVNATHSLSIPKITINAP